MLRGVDVSVLQGDIDWKAVVAEGLRFAIIKCAEGNKPAADAKFHANRDGAKAAGIVVGAYNFAYPLPHIAPSDAAKQHYDLCEGLGSDPGDLPPALDLEWPEPGDWQKWNCNADQIRGWALGYLDAATSLWGCTPTLYTYPNFWMRIGGPAESEFATYALWIASYQHPLEWPNDTMKPLSFGPWGGKWAIWQSSGGSFYKLPNGAPCDTDLFNGDEAALQAFCAGSRV
jgi:GH25 family lysozyme M1 (1,4-beta-N-acetylmuramidase)